jgi:hypothetical protein
MPAEPASVRAPRRKRWFRRLLLVLLLGPPLLLGLGNLALATPWAKQRAAAEIHRRCGLEAEIGSITLTPWGGAAIGELRLRQPEPLRASMGRPLLEVRSIRVIPRWGALLKGDLQVEEIRVVRPQAAIAVEMLASLAGAGKVPAEPPVAAGPPVAVAPPSEVAPVSPPAGQPELAPPAPAPVGQPRATTWLEITDGDVELFLGGKEVAGLTRYGGRAPIGGRPASGSFMAESASIFGRELVSHLGLPVSWADPTLRLGAGDLMVAGVRLRVAAVAGRLRGFPFELEIRADGQAVDLSDVLPGSQVEHLSGGLRAQGLLTSPSGWRGLAAFQMRHLSLATGDQTLLFGDASASFGMQGGNIACPDLRVIGETVSFLGNGSFRGGEGISLVLRAVMRPEMAEAWRQRLEKAGAAVPPVFSDMEAPGRVFIDLRWTSYPGGQGIEFGPGGPVLPPDLALWVFGSGS